MAKRAYAAVRQRRPQVREGRVRLQRRAVRGEQHDAADGIEFAAVDCPALAGEIEDKRLVRRHEHLERRALRNLLPEIAGRAVDGRDVEPGVALETGDDLVERELQVGCRGDARSLRHGGCNGETCRDEHGGEPRQNPGETG